MDSFNVGQVYNRRRDIHGRFKGQQQGGMSTPADHPLIFLFTGEGGAEYGYRDEFRHDGTLWYTGEGQEGDMEFVRSNRALRDHREEGKRVHLFEEYRRGEVRYVGEVEYVGHHFEDRPDVDGCLRRAIVFELAIVPPGSLPPSNEDATTIEQIGQGEHTLRRLRSKSLAELRRLALQSAGSHATSEERRREVRVRSDAVREYVLMRADGHCEGCGREAPFKTKRGRPYLEPHHTARLADGGPDHPAHVIALCPTCHRRVHHGRGGDEYNAELIGRLTEVEGAA